ncbi:MAG: DUF362 domain-containing protein [Synergistetes bacterium]|nr:DUF362 domain-containing protein [Synergistota bacterium]
MAASRVYFMDMRATAEENAIKKFERLLKTARIGNMEFSGRTVALKIHFGEPGNLAYIKPNYVAKLVRFLKGLGAKPFLTDTNTLYRGKRSNAIDHLDVAMRNGFNPIVVECNVIIADGLWGFDYREVEVNLKHFDVAKIASAIAEADVLISLAHFKGHELTGFGGAIKNLGMGCASREGKLRMHSTSKPKMEKEKCVSCGECIRNCNYGAIRFDSDGKATINYDLCVGCGQCVVVCPSGAVQIVWETSIETCERIVEYAYAVLKDKPAFHINFVMNVSPYCDCWHYNDAPIVPDIGILASFDPVALDKASVDLVNNAPLNPYGPLGDREISPGEDKFSILHPKTSWKAMLDYAEEIGLGTQKYELIKI